MSGLTSIPINPSRSRLLVAIALLAFALAAALATANASAATGSGSKPTGSAANPGVAAAQAPDRSVSRRAAAPAATQALTTIQRRIADYVATHGTKYTFASYLDSSGRVVLDT